MSKPLKGKIENTTAYMLAIPRNEADIESPDKLFAHLRGAKDFTLMNISHDEELDCPTLYIAYKEEIYLIAVEPADFNYDEGYFKHKLSDENIEELEAATTGLQLSMLFSKHALDSYHLLLKVLYCLVPDLIGVYNCNSFMLLSPLWVRTAAEAATPPAPSYLYTIHAVSDDNGKVWLHTHGLNCCGVMDLEIIETDKEHYSKHGDVLTNMADNAISKGTLADEKELIYTGSLASGEYLVTTWVNWREGLKMYDENIMGGIKDREDEAHAQDTGLVFAYLSEGDYKKGKYTPLTKIKEEEWENPLYMVSDEETLRMSELARERLPYLREGLKRDGAQAIVKIGLDVDKDSLEEAGCDHEHIWFEVDEITGDRISGSLIQEPYFVASMHEGSTGTYTFDKLTDWILYVDDQKITPDSVYLLSLLN